VGPHRAADRDVQLHGAGRGTVGGADGGVAHISDGERADIDGRAE